jgi:hypothetical protein
MLAVAVLPVSPACTVGIASQAVASNRLAKSCFACIFFRSWRGDYLRVRKYNPAMNVYAAHESGKPEWAAELCKTLVANNLKLVSQTDSLRVFLGLWKN